jgi:hypothetical protein
MAAEKRGIGVEAALHMHGAELYARDRICAVAAGRALERCMVCHVGTSGIFSSLVFVTDKTKVSCP